MIHDIDYQKQQIGKLDFIEMFKLKFVSVVCTEKSLQLVI